MIHDWQFPIDNRQLRLITPAAFLPVLVSEAKDAMRISATAIEEHWYLQTLLRAATGYVERRTGRALVTQTWELILQRWPSRGHIVLPLPPLQSVTSVKYKDDSAIESTMASTDYIVSDSLEPGRITLKQNASWPSVTLLAQDPIRIRFVAGYPDIPSIPEEIKLAILLLTGHWYENREEVTADAANVPRRIEAGAEMLLGERIGEYVF